MLRTVDFIDAGYRVQRFSRDHTIRSTEVTRKSRRDIMLPYRRGNFKHKGAYFRVEAHYLLAISVKVDEIVGSVKSSRHLIIAVFRRGDSRERPEC